MSLDWTLVEPLIERLLELPEAERRDWLERECGGDRERAAEVWRHFELAVREDGFLAFPLDQEADVVGASAPTAWCAPWAPAAWERCGWPSASTGSSNSRSP